MKYRIMKEGKISLDMREVKKSVSNSDIFLQDRGITEISPTFNLLRLLLVVSEITFVKLLKHTKLFNDLVPYK